MIDGVYRELGLDLETLGKDGERLDKGLGHGPIPRHDIGIGIAVDPLNHEANQIVSEAMKRAGVLLCIGAVG